MVFVFGEDIIAPHFFFFDYGEDKTAAQKKFFALREDKNSGPILFTNTTKTKKITPLFFSPSATLTPQQYRRLRRRNVAENPCCGKPHIAFGKCCRKWQFRPECCASATAQQLINALVHRYRGAARWSSSMVNIYYHAPRSWYISCDDVVVWGDEPDFFQE